ncbi:MAG: hydantoin racemase [Synergistaceae bacterium]|nr:hydantoin racemase [Synergistaceae bacterium]
MTKRRIGLIRVLTTSDEDLLNLHGSLVMKYFPGFEVVSRCIPDQPEGIHDDETERIAVPKVLALAGEMERDGMEAVIVSCAGDPAVAEANAELKVPVIGAGRAAASAALVLGRPAGVLGITKEVPAAIRRILGELLVAEAVPEGVESTLDLMKPGGKQILAEAGRHLVEKGAGAIVLACTGMSTIGAAAGLREALGIPVVDPVQAQAAAAWVALG